MQCPYMVFLTNASVTYSDCHLVERWVILLCVPCSMIRIFQCVVPQITSIKHFILLLHLGLPQIITAFSALHNFMVLHCNLACPQMATYFRHLVDWRKSSVFNVCLWWTQLLAVIYLAVLVISSPLFSVSWYALKPLSSPIFPNSVVVCQLRIHLQWIHQF